MKNKNVGFLICGIAVIMVVIVMIFNLGMKDIVSQTCTHGPSCTMYDSIAIQTYLSLALAGIVLIIGLFFIFSKENETIILKTKIIKEKLKPKKLDLAGLDKDEKKLIILLQQENNAMFQKTLMEKMDIGKVKATRLLDRLEAKQLIERKRRGMNNIVVLKA